MQTIAETRRLRLGELRTQFRTWVAINKKLQLSARDATLSQIWNRAPDSKTGRPREMGTPLARRIEDCCGLPKGWMDTPPVSPTSEHRSQPPRDPWPFASIRYGRFENLTSDQKQDLEDLVEHQIAKFETKNGCRKRGQQGGAREGGQKRAGGLRGGRPC